MTSPVAGETAPGIPMPTVPRSPVSRSAARTRLAIACSVAVVVCRAASRCGGGSAPRRRRRARPPRSWCRRDRCRCAGSRHAARPQEQRQRRPPPASSEWISGTPAGAPGAGRAIRIEPDRADPGVHARRRCRSTQESPTITASAARHAHRGRARCRRCRDRVSRRRRLPTRSSTSTSRRQAAVGQLVLLLLEQIVGDDADARVRPQRGQQIGGAVEGAARRPCSRSDRPTRPRPRRRRRARRRAPRTPAGTARAARRPARCGRPGPRGASLRGTRVVALERVEVECRGHARDAPPSARRAPSGDDRRACRRDRRGRRAAPSAIRRRSLPSGVRSGGVRSRVGGPRLALRRSAARRSAARRSFLIAVAAWRAASASLALLAGEEPRGIEQIEQPFVGRSAAC